VDVLEKPGLGEPDGAWERKLLSTVRLLARVKVITHPRARLGALSRSSPDAPRTPALPYRPAEGARRKVIAIGASTGGPGAVVEILSALPAGFPLPVLLVLHISAPFGEAFADWLDGQTRIRVAYAKGGERIEAAAGRVLMAPPNLHLAVQGGRLWLTEDPERHSCRPSVDVLFESVARDLGSAAVGCLLTGMGRDGAAGLLELHRAGAMTIAQDESTSVVYGMPREAVRLGAARRILPLAEIGPALALFAEEHYE
jgi:two-component system chemotaxis response regulator CheB